MMFCQKCSGGIFLNQIKDRLVCDRCGFEILIQDGFVIFHPEDSNMHSGMESAILDDLAFYEEKHFWMKTRRFFIRRTFDKYINNTDKIIEIGAGTGNISRCLMENGYKDISVGEVHLNGLEYAKCYGIKNRYQFDLMKTPFLEHFDTVGMFDVLEHIDNDDLAVKNIYKMLKHGGKAIVTVPAHKWLWSKQDTIAYHRQRYEVNQLKRLFEANGFKILKASAFFFSILPLLYFRKLINRDDGNIKSEDFKNRFYVNPIINWLFEKILNIEIRLLDLADYSLKYGGSIILVVEK